MKFSKSDLRRIILEELDFEKEIQEEIDAYIDNPLDTSMAKDVAFHPRMMKARMAAWNAVMAACQRKHGGVTGQFYSDPSDPETQERNRKLDGYERYEKELNKIGTRLNSLYNQVRDDSLPRVGGPISGEELFSKMRDVDPEYDKLVARQKELVALMKDAEVEQREIGRQAGANVHRKLKDFMDAFQASGADGCPFLASEYTPKKKAERIAEWEKAWRRKLRTPLFNDGTPAARREKLRKHQEEDDKRDRRRKEQELSLSRPSALDRYRRGIRGEVKETISKSNLMRIIKEELASFLKGI